MPSSPAERPILLALQGGGSHGALAWGVLDTLLGDEDLRVDAISGTSAGALNAATLAAGIASGGRAGGRAALNRLWSIVGRAGAISPLRRTPLDRWLGRWDIDDNPAYAWFDGLSRLLSPYQLSLPDANPLRPILEAAIDFDALNSEAAPRVFVTATNVETGLPRVFTQPELTPETIMASAALPHLFRAVEIDGEAYWDGGYVGNPALYPLVRDRAEADVVLVQTNPFHRPGIPRTARAIADRLNEITFNAALLKELRVAWTAGRMPGSTADIRLHRIGEDAALTRFAASAKLNAEPAYLAHLRAEGAAQARAFLDRHAEDIGRRSSFDPTPMIDVLMGPPDVRDVASTGPRQVEGSP